MNSGPAGVRYWNISEVWVVEEKVSISLSPLPSPNPCGTKARPVCQAVEVCCRMPPLGWPVQQHDFNQKRGQREGRRGEVTCLIHTLNGVVDRRSQECSEKALSSGVTWVIIMKISLENTHCLLHCLCLIQHGPKFLLVDYAHTHTHSNTLILIPALLLKHPFSPSFCSLLYSSLKICCLLFDHLSVSSESWSKPSVKYI